VGCKKLGKLYVINTSETIFVDFIGIFQKMENYCPLAQERIYHYESQEALTLRL